LQLWHSVQVGVVSTCNPLGDPVGNNHRNSSPVNIVAMTTHICSALEIDVIQQSCRMMVCVVLLAPND
jgi:hypothetical protein